MMCEYQLIYCLTTVGRVMVFGLHLDVQRSTDVGLSDRGQFGELARFFLPQIDPEIFRLIHQIVTARKGLALFSLLPYDRLTVQEQRNIIP